MWGCERADGLHLTRLYESEEVNGEESWLHPGSCKQEIKHDLHTCFGLVYAHTYVPTQLRTYVCVYVHNYIPTYVLGISLCIHKFTHTLHVHTYVHYMCTHTLHVHKCTHVST